MVDLKIRDPVFFVEKVHFLLVNRQPDCLSHLNLDVHRGFQLYLRLIDYNIDDLILSKRLGNINFSLKRVLFLLRTAYGEILGRIPKTRSIVPPKLLLFCLNFAAKSGRILILKA